MSAARQVYMRLFAGGQLHISVRGIVGDKKFQGAIEASVDVALLRLIVSLHQKVIIDGSLWRKD